MASRGAQRSSESDELRDHGFPAGVRLSARESRKTYAGGASQRAFDFVERHAGTRRTLCAAAARLSPARHTRKSWLIWRFVDATTRSRSQSWTRFLPNSFDRSRQAPIQTASRPPNSASLAHQRTGKKRRFARNGNFMSNLNYGASFGQRRKRWQRTWSS